MLKTAEKIPYFADGVPLFDRTATQRVEIEPRKGFNLLTNQTVLGMVRGYGLNRLKKK